MQRLANGTQVAALPAAAPLVGTPGYGTNGDPVVGPQASVFDADQYNRIQEEIVSVIAAAGIALNGSNFAQLLAALTALYEQKLSYSPVQGGTGIGQIATNIMKMGWTGAAGPYPDKVRVTVDASDQGNIAFEPWVEANYEPLVSGVVATESWVAGNYEPLVSGVVATESWVLALTNGNAGSNLGGLSFTTPVGTIRINFWFNVTGTQDSSGNWVTTLPFSLPLTNRILGAAFCATNGAANDFGQVAEAGPSTLGGINVTFHDPGGGAGQNAGVSGIVVGI